MERYDVQYTCGFFKDGALHGVIKPPVVPHTVLVDPTGVIVWEGHPKHLTDLTVEKALRGASPHLRFGWDAEFDDVARAVCSDHFADALTLAKALPIPGSKDVQRDVKDMLARRISKMQKALKAGDPLRAHDAASALEGCLNGLPGNAAVEKVRSKLRGDEALTTLLRGQQELRQLKRMTPETDEASRAIIEKAERLAQRYAGTIVERQAMFLVARLDA